MSEVAQNRERVYSGKTKRLVKGLQKMCLGQENKSKCSFPSRKKMYYGVGTYRRTFLNRSEYVEITFLNRSEYVEIIKRCTQHIDSEIVKHQQPALYQWPQPPPSREPVEDPELEDWWKEMKISTHAHNFLHYDNVL
ncbi:hypothetical protein AQUCO_06300042v1 [Aquilegia coerulea]|uniref:Uncharacterized protein n=1 Tax=Aquilegia coerulea TaxID=218851 RepID=A0A2G5CCW0_AQUCA|nr:hypothetical protein AQUCO_06300042v1 [Aquilegia coerulea]